VAAIKCLQEFRITSKRSEAGLRYTLSSAVETRPVLYRGRREAAGADRIGDSLAGRAAAADVLVHTGATAAVAQAQTKES
jgi:hypothetical protein